MDQITVDFSLLNPIKTIQSRWPTIETLYSIVETIIKIDDKIFGSSDDSCSVYKGSLDAEDVVMKFVVIDKNSIQFIMRERIALHKIKDSNLNLNLLPLLCYEFPYLERNAHVFFTKYLGDLNLDKYIRYSESFNDSWSQRFIIMDLMTAALKQLEDVKIISNDFKPKNLMVQFNKFDIVDFVTIIDLGAADDFNPEQLVKSKAVLKPVSTSRFLSSRNIISQGTEGYICPTRDEDKKSSSPACDTFRYLYIVYYLKFYLTILIVIVN